MTTWETYGNQEVSRQYQVDFSPVSNYRENSSLIDNVTFQEGNNTQLITRKTYDNFNRLTTIENIPSGWDCTLNYSYWYNLANQRTQMLDEDNFTWDYGYDLLGQLKSARCAYNEEAAFVYNYDFDGIGNRKQTSEGFEGETADVWDYISNSLNQYTSRTHDNATDNFTYDLDGNLTQDGTWNYTWDGENRLVGQSSREARNSNPIQKLIFVYDDQGRRVSKTVQDLNSDNTTYITSVFRRFVYDGWNMIAELDQEAHPVGTYVWGSDLSGTIQGAGGVGGLVMAKHWHVGDNATTFPAYDGNGNVRGLFRSDNGTIETYLSYDPFGQTFSYNRNPAAPNPFGFLTKPFDNETGFYYFGKRYKSDRWISRDQIEEDGGLNLYAYVGNDPISKFDPLGNDIYLITGNNSWNPINNALHQKVCADQCGKKKKVCFTYPMIGFKWFEAKRTWLGWSSDTLRGSLLEGEIREDDYSGGTIVRRKSSTPAQDRSWINWMRAVRQFNRDVYSVARHNCRMYSQLEFADAPGNHCACW